MTDAKSKYVIGRTIPTLTWGRERGGFHSRISLFNYYSLLFEDRQITSRAIIYLFQEDGTEAAVVEKTLKGKEQWQFNLSESVKDFQGTIGVQLVPDFMPQLTHPNYVGTLFFGTYWDEKGHCDFTHETDRMRFAEDVKEQYESTPIPTSPRIETDIILQNSFFGTDEKDCDRECRLQVRSAAGESLAEEKITLAPRASRVVSLNELLPDYRKRFGAAPGSVHARGRHINQPLTLHRHASGDFNIHHF